jgi:hypothetical protein
MQRIKLYSIVSPCQCTGSPASTVILIAADPCNGVLDNHGSAIGNNNPRKEAAGSRGVTLSLGLPQPLLHSSRHSSRPAIQKVSNNEAFIISIA